MASLVMPVFFPLFASHCCPLLISMSTPVTSSFSFSVSIIFKPFCEISSYLLASGFSDSDSVVAGFQVLLCPELFCLSIC